MKGRAILDAFRIVARDVPRPVYRVDDGIPAGLDEPAEGARVSAPFHARGWCQEAGGGRVEPVEFRLDGLRIVDAVVTRTPRPDVASVFPALGDRGRPAGRPCSRRACGPGRHVLTVTFQAGDRRRVYLPREMPPDERTPGVTAHAPVRRAEDDEDLVCPGVAGPEFEDGLVPRGRAVAELRERPADVGPRNARRREPAFARRPSR